MHPHLAAVFARLDDAHATLRAAIDRVPERLRAQKPGENRWSVNDVLEHLAIVETRFSKQIGESIAAARQAGLGPEEAARTPLSDQIESTLVNRASPRTAPAAAQPTGTLDAAQAWAAVERSRETIRRTIASADGLALSQVTYAHPFFGSLNVYQWVELLSGHRVRHAEQIREIADRLATA